MVGAKIDLDARRRRVVVASTLVGATAEWYDFFIFGILSALFLNKLFFPTFDPLVGTLLSFGTFATAWIARPIGGVVAGHIGDRIGRKKTLYWSFMMMGIASTLIGLLPTYQTAGAWAPFLLVVLRFVQGLSVGAEYGGAVVTLVEHAKKTRRVLFGSITQMGTLMGLLLGNLTFFLIGKLDQEVMMTWGWRVPFILSLAMLLVGVYIRSQMEESPEFKKIQVEGNVERQPLKFVIKNYPRQLFSVMFAQAAPSTFFYVCVVFMVSYGVNTLGFSQPQMLGFVCIGAVVELITLPLFGILADVLGRRKVLVSALLFLAVAAVPFFLMVETRSALWMSVAYVLMLGIGHSAVLAIVPTYFADMFPAPVRYTGLSAAYQTSGVIFAGPLPIIATLLIAAQDGSIWIFVGYTVALAVLSLFAVLWGVEHYSLLPDQVARKRHQAATAA